VKIAIVNNCVPFVSGGAEYLAKALRSKLIEQGHEALLVKIPFKWNPPSAIVEHILACRSLRVAGVDLMIGLKFPAYYLPHPNKVLWLLHQFRQAYDLWGTPYQDLPDTHDGRRIREIVLRSDNTYLREARKIYTISEVTQRRLSQFNGIPSEVLYTPLLRSDHLRHKEYGDYLFSPGRITRGKRQALIAEAMRFVTSNVRLVIAGQPETEADLAELQRIVSSHHLAGRVTVIPRFISEEEKADLFASALGCVYIPYDEDALGYVTLEAFHCRKPVITCTDSGGISLLVRDKVTGREVEPDPVALAEAIDGLAEDRKRAAEWGNAGYEYVKQLGLTWENVIAKLTS